MAKTLDQVFKEKKITTQAAAFKFCKGKKFKIVTPLAGQAGSGHSYGPAGSTFIATVSGPSSFSYLAGPNGGCPLLVGRNTIYYHEVIMIGGTLADLEEEQKDNLAQINQLKEDNNTLDEKMEYMKVNGLVDYDDELFKVFNILKVLDRKTVTGMDRAKAVREIIDLS